MSNGKEKSKKSLKILPCVQDEESLINIHDRFTVPLLFTCISPPASGKSTTIMNIGFNLFNEGSKPFFTRVIYISPTVLTDRSLKGLRDLHDDEDNDQIEIKLITGEHILDLENTLGEIIEYLAEMKAEDKQEDRKTLIVIDDCMAFMKRNVFKSNLTRLCSTYRHIGYSTSICLAVQSYKGVPKAVRELASGFIFGSGIAGKTKQEICEDMENVFGDDFEEYFNEATRKKYNFCFCDMRQQKIYHNFDKLLYSKNN